MRLFALSIAFLVPQECNEIIRIIYRFLSSAITGGRVDTLTITATHFEWRGSGVVVSRFDLKPLPYQKLSFEDAFRIVVARDTYVQNFVHLVRSTPTEEVYHIGVEPPTVASEAEEA